MMHGPTNIKFAIDIPSLERYGIAWCRCFKIWRKKHSGKIKCFFFQALLTCILQQVIEGKIKGQIEVTRRRGRRRKKLLDDFKNRRGYRQLKEEALDRTTWKNRFGRGFGPVVWQITDDDDDDDDGDDDDETYVGLYVEKVHFSFMLKIRCLHYGQILFLYCLTLLIQTLRTFGKSNHSVTGKPTASGIL